jgi:hypothetical protein
MYISHIGLVRTGCCNAWTYTKEGGGGVLMVDNIGGR